MTDNKIEEDKSKIEIRDDIEGFVNSESCGGFYAQSMIVVGDKVFKPVYSGPALDVGYVKKGVAYENTSDGSSRVLGAVYYLSEKNIQINERGLK